jgi:D-threo-aldose 1-dehydrogenase
MLNLAQSRGIAVMNAAPYASGILAKGSAAYPRYAYQEANDAALAPIRRLEAIAARHHVPLGAAALQFSLRDRRVVSTVCGITRPERVGETLEWARFPIPEAFWQEVTSLPFATDDPEATRTHYRV